VLELVCIRHGESEGNVQGLAQGALPYPLTPTGRAQVEAAAALLGRMPWRPDRLVSSPVKRCVDSALLLAARLGLPDPVLDGAFSEIDSGRGTGRPFEELVAEHPVLLDRSREGIGGFESFGGESVDALLTRVARGLDAQPPGARVVLVTHGAVFKAAMAHLLGIRPGFWLDLRPASILRLERVAAGSGELWSLTHLLHPGESG